MGPKRRGKNPAPSLDEEEDVGCAEEVLKP